MNQTHSSRMSGHGFKFVRSRLLLEEVFERFAGVVGAPRARGHRRGSRSVSHRRGVFLHVHSHFEERALILRVLLRDSLGDRLRALELPSRIEVDALLAAMQFRLATRTFSAGVESRRQHRSAIRAARAHHGSDHARRPRPHHIVLGTRRFRRPALAIFVAALAAVAVAVTVFVTSLSILPFHVLPPRERHYLKRFSRHPTTLSSNYTSPPSTLSRGETEKGPNKNSYRGHRARGTKDRKLLFAFGRMIPLEIVSGASRLFLLLGPACRGWTCLSRQPCPSWGARLAVLGFPWLVRPAIAHVPALAGSIFLSASSPKF